ncbi:hypothetical protein ACRBEV_10260 [Methylobacterium phyllosphaerae]
MNLQRGISIVVFVSLLNNASAQDFRLGMSLTEAEVEAQRVGLQMGRVNGTDDYALSRRLNDGTYDFSGFVSFCKGRLFSRGWPLAGGFEALTHSANELENKYGAASLRSESEYIAQGLLSSLTMKWRRQDGIEESLSGTTVTGGNVNAKMSVSRSFSAKSLMCL